ncbi:MAG TPA: BON domain-containing protein [Kofleriaceae bacterium]|nr:BON domain-containing protein [Kofleriaceae bacterium]
MPSQPSKGSPKSPATTYDEIVRRTVVDPDSSVRPSPDQIQAAREGFRALDDDEQALTDRVTAALAGFPGVTVEVSRDLVTLRGRVPDPGALQALETAVARVPGVETVHNQVVIG